MGIVRSGGPIGAGAAKQDVTGHHRWYGFEQHYSARIQDDFLGSDYDHNVWEGGFDVGGSVEITPASSGVIRLATDATSGDRTHLFGELNWYPNKGIHFETRVKLDDITNVAMVVGLTDQKGEASGVLPVALSGTTWTTTATDFIGFCFNTAATTDTIRGMAVAADVDGTSVDSSYAWVAATWVTLRIEIQASGAATFFYNDRAFGGIVAPAATITTALCPFWGVRNANGTAHLLDVDYCWLTQGRT